MSTPSTLPPTPTPPRAEAEAQNGIFAPDEITLDWYKRKGITDLPYPRFGPGDQTFRSGASNHEKLAVGSVRRSTAAITKSLAVGEVTQYRHRCENEKQPEMSHSGRLARVPAQRPERAAGTRAILSPFNPFRAAMLQAIDPSHPRLSRHFKYNT